MNFNSYVIYFTEVKQGSKKTNVGDVNVWTGQTICTFKMNEIIYNMHDKYWKAIYGESNGWISISTSYTLRKLKKAPRKQMLLTLTCEQVKISVVWTRWHCPFYDVFPMK